MIEGRHGTQMVCRIGTIMGRLRKVGLVLQEHYGYIGRLPEVSAFLTSYGGNPGNEGSYQLFHRVLWRMKKGEYDEAKSDRSKTDQPIP